MSSFFVVNTQLDAYCLKCITKISPIVLPPLLWLTNTLCLPVSFYLNFKANLLIKIDQKHKTIFSSLYNLTFISSQMENLYFYIPFKKFLVILTWIHVGVSLKIILWLIYQKVKENHHLHQKTLRKCVAPILVV